MIYASPRSYQCFKCLCNCDIMIRIGVACSLLKTTFYYSRLGCTQQQVVCGGRLEPILQRFMIPSQMIFHFTVLSVLHCISYSFGEFSVEFICYLSRRVVLFDLIVCVLCFPLDASFMFIA